MMRFRTVLYVVELWCILQVVVTAGLLEDVIGVIHNPHAASPPGVTSDPPVPTTPSTPIPSTPMPPSPVPIDTSTRQPDQNMHVNSGVSNSSPSLPDAFPRGTSVMPETPISSINTAAPPSTTLTSQTPTQNANTNTNTDTALTHSRHANAAPHSPPAPANTTQTTPSSNTSSKTKTNKNNPSNASSHANNNNNNNNSSSSTPPAFTPDETMHGSVREQGSKMPVVVGVLCALGTTVCSSIAYLVYKRRKRSRRAKKNQRTSLSLNRTQPSPRVPPMTAAAAADDIFMAQRTMDEYHLPKHPSLSNLQPNAMYPSPPAPFPPTVMQQGNRESRLLANQPTYPSQTTPYYVAQDERSYTSPYYPAQPLQPSQVADLHEREAQDYYYHDSSLSQSSTLPSSSPPVLTGPVAGISGPAPAYEHVQHPQNSQNPQTVFSPPHAYDN